MDKNRNVSIVPKNDYIKTPTLSIEKNVMVWENHTMIQLSNISYLSAEKLPTVAFPIWTLILVLVGFAFMQEMVILGLAIWALSAWFIYGWYSENEKREEGAILHIKMNSGSVLNFEFNNKQFLERVAAKLHQIMVEGGSGNKVLINISNNTIQDSSLLDNMNIQGY